MIDGKKRIVIIDDEEAILFGFRQVLEEASVAVDTASTADEGKKLASNNAYSAAIVDLRLSNSIELEGFELVRYLKENQKNCRVIIVTAYGDEPTRKEALSLGVDLFLEKPVDPETIKKNLTAFGIY